MNPSLRFNNFYDGKWYHPSGNKHYYLDNFDHSNDPYKRKRRREMEIIINNELKKIESKKAEKDVLNNFMMNVSNDYMIFIGLFVMFCVFIILLMNLFIKK